MGKLIQLEDKKPKFEVINKSSSTVEIALYGAIGEDYWDEGSVSAKQFHDMLKELPANITQIDLRVNSPGGSVFEGISIYERLKQHKAKVTAYIDGMAASIASIIILAADEIVISEGGFIMIHKPMSHVWGNSQEMERMIALLDKIENQMVGIYSRKTGMSRLEISQMLESGDTWFTAEDAVEAKLVDYISGQADLRMVASLEKAQWIKNAPELPKINAKKVHAILDGRLEEMKKVLARK